jgi:transcriptional regulator with XRE-family HTH domain
MDGLLRGGKFIPAIIDFLGYDPIPKPACLHERLVWFRRRKGWTQETFAKVLGVDKTTLAKWERGERVPKGKYVEKVMVVFKRCLDCPHPQGNARKDKAINRKRNGHLHRFT